MEKKKFPGKVTPYLFILPWIIGFIVFTAGPLIPVSYTHLDVYKRQGRYLRYYCCKAVIRRPWPELHEPGSGGQMFLTYCICGQDDYLHIQGCGSKTHTARKMCIRDSSITIDGINIRHISRDNLRHNIAMVLQDTHLFTGTVMELSLIHI